MYILSDKDYNLPDTIDSPQGKPSAVDLNMVKTYKSDIPVSDVIGLFKNNYDQVDFSAVERVTKEGRRELGEPLLSADDEGNIYPQNLRMLVDNEVEFSLEQYVEIDPKAINGMEPGEEGYDEPYVITVEITASDKESIEEVFSEFHGSYEDILEEFSESEHYAKEVNRQFSDGSANQPQTSSSSKKEASLADKYKVDLDGYSKDDIVMDDEVMNKVENMIEGPLKNPDLYKNMPETRKGIILEGEPGVGKTLLAKVLSAESDANMYAVTVSDIMTKWVGESARNVDKIFNMAKEYAPSVIFMDEADSLLMERTGKSSHNEDENMVNTLLKNMDGMAENKGVKVIAATNKIEKVDEAFLRHGRFGEPVTIGKPNEEARKEIYRIHTFGKNNGITDEELENYLDDFAKMSEGFTGADIAGVVHKAAEDKLNELKQSYESIKDIPPESMKLEPDKIFEAIEMNQEGEEEGLGFDV